MKNAEIANKHLTLVCGIHETILNHNLTKFVDIPISILNIRLKTAILILQFGSIIHFLMLIPNHIIFSIS